MKIRTLTLSPALDYSVGIKGKLTLGAINRTSKEEYEAGGKGINVSVVLKRLGYPSIALGFLSGFTGDYIEKLLKEEGLTVGFVHTDGITRINVKIEGDIETAINGEGPKVKEEDLKKLIERIDESVDGDVLIMSGQIPPTLPDDTYERILERIQGKNILTVVDSTGKLLTDSLKYHPFLVKPNGEELGEIVGRVLVSKDDIVKAAKELQKMGARNVLVSLGGQGAILVAEDGKTYFKEAMYDKVVSTVGAGDSMVAGFITGYLKTHDFERALMLALSAGSATAFSKGLATKEKAMTILKKMYGRDEI